MKKIKYVIPYIAMLIITPIYSLLDRYVIVEILGCGCVPSAQTNMLNIAFNANDFRYVFYSTLTVLLTIISVKISREVTAKGTRVLYCAGVLVINALFCMWICKAAMWN